jgi:hypothetical protein
MLFEAMLQQHAGDVGAAIRGVAEHEAAMAANAAAEEEGGTFGEEDYAAFLNDHPHVMADRAGFQPYLEAAGMNPYHAVQGYDAWLEKINEAARVENVEQPKSFDDAMNQAYSQGLFGRSDPPQSARRGGLSDAVDGWAEELRAENATRSLARDVVRQSQQGGG